MPIPASGMNRGNEQEGGGKGCHSPFYSRLKIKKSLFLGD
jgi:hypothetical protein